MNSLNWEVFEEELNSGHYYCKDKGEFSFEFQDFRVYRNLDLQLIFEVYNESSIELPTLNFENEKFEAGQFIDDDLKPVLLVHKFSGNTVMMNGVVITRRNQNTNLAKGKIKTTEVAQISSVSWASGSVRQEYKPKYLMEWVENFQSSSWMFPDSKKTKSESKTEISFSNNEFIDSKMVRESGNEKNSRNCIFLEVGGYEFCLGVVEKTDSKTAGFILYKEVVDSDERFKIRQIVSFLLGAPLIYLGCSIFSENWRLLTLESFTVYESSKRYREIKGLPPTIYSSEINNFIGRENFNFSLNKIFSMYDEYNFNHIFFIYWTAISSPSLSAAVHFGALIEFVQKQYIKINNSSITKLIEKSKLKTISDDMNDLIDQSDFPDSIKIIFKNKISNLNAAPQSMVLDRFAELINLELLDIEKKAWQQRNNAAHGNEVSSDSEVMSAIVNTTIIKILFHKVLFLVTASSESYFNYAVIGYPLCKL